MKISQDYSIKEVVLKESQEFYLPVEVWIYTWSFLDFNTRQKICTLVSKTWLNQIRNSLILSGKMKIEIDLDKTPPNFEIEETAQRMKNLEDLKIKGSFPSRAIISEIGFASFKNLKNVEFDIKYCPIQGLIATLNYMASLNLKISGHIIVSDKEIEHSRGSLMRDDCLGEQAKNIFKEAVTILNKKIPGKSENFKIYGGKIGTVPGYPDMVRCIRIKVDRNIAAIEYEELVDL